MNITVLFDDAVKPAVIRVIRVQGVAVFGTGKLVLGIVVIVSTGLQQGDEITLVGEVIAEILHLGQCLSFQGLIVGRACPGAQYL